MANTLAMMARNQSMAASTTSYDSLAQSSRRGPMTEANSQRTTQQALTLSLLYANISSNNRGASTIRVRINGVNGNQVLSIGASTTGEFEDTTNTDSVAVGDEINWQTVTGAGGTSFILNVVSTVVAASTNTVMKHDAQGGFINVASTTRYRNLVSSSDWTTPEASMQFEMRHAGTAKNAFVYVVTARATATTIRLRVNSLNGNTVVTCTGGTTGIFQDTVNTDAIVSGDTLGWSVTTGTGTDNFECSIVDCDIESTDSTFQFISTPTGAGITLGTNVTNYWPIGGRVDNVTTETNVDADAQFAFTASNLIIYVSANTITAASTLRLRINGANGNQSVSVTASTTGWFEDTVNTDTIAAADEINYSFVTGGTGTNLTVRTVGCVATVSAAVAAVGRIPTLLLMGVG